MYDVRGKNIEESLPTTPGYRGGLVKPMPHICFSGTGPPTMTLTEPTIGPPRRPTSPPTSQRSNRPSTQPCHREHRR